MTKQTEIILRLQHRCNFVKTIESELGVVERYKYWKHLNKRMRIEALKVMKERRAA